MSKKLQHLRKRISCQSDLMMRWLKGHYTLILIWAFLERTFGGCGSRADMPFPSRKSEASPGEFPWQVSVKHDDTPVCSGTIISDFWVISAAQCFTDLRKNSAMEVGVVNLEEKGRVYPIESKILHKGYSKGRTENNIALLKSSEEIQFNNMVQPACFPEDHNLRIDHLSNCWIATWQDQIRDSKLYVLLQKLPVIPMETCNFNHTKEIMCGVIGLVPEGSDCSTDSGDSLVCQHGERKLWALTGIVSKSSSSCSETFIFASVSNYINWVKENTALEGKPFIPTLDVDMANERSPQKNVLTNYTFNIIDEIPDLTIGENNSKTRNANTAKLLKAEPWVVVLPFGFLMVCIALFT